MEHCEISNVCSKEQGQNETIHTVTPLHVYAIESGLTHTPNPIELTRAFRRAVMARVQAHLGESVPLPPFFSGHGPDGMPARSEQHPHLFFLFDPDSSRLMILAPHFVDRREPNEEERRHLHDLQQAMNGFNELRAGAMGCLRLRQITVDPKTDPLFAPARVWDSITPYTVTRHMKLGSATHALATDLYAECDRRGLPTPSVIPQDIQGIPGVGLNALVRLIFPEPIPGPMILGRRRYIGGGVFMAHLTME